MESAPIHTLTHAGSCPRWLERDGPVAEASLWDAAKHNGRYVWLGWMRQ